MFSKGFTDEESTDEESKNKCVCCTAEWAPVHEAATIKVQAAVHAAACTVTCSNSKEVLLVSPSANEKKHKIEGSTEDDRGSKWTTYSNLKVQFNRWKQQDLMELKFGSEDKEGSLVIPNNQLARIFNINETRLSLDGADGQCGGRPAV